MNKKAPDAVNHPPHYAGLDGGSECIEAIRAALGRDGFIAFLRGTQIAYLWRLGRKGDAAAEDAAKTEWYAKRLREELGG
jgi:hypothetical protein